MRFFIGEQHVRYWKSYIMGVYLRFVRFFIADFKLILSGDIDKVEETKNKRSFFMVNHQTELDWIFSCYFLQMFDKESDFSAVMKGSLGKIPILGPVVQDLNMCLLDRHWETDQDHFRHFLERFESHPCAECVFFCPEGTTITRASYERSKSFAQRSNRPKFEHVLLPRSTGLAFIIKELREWEENTGESVYLYNITMQFEGYSGEICSDDNYGREVDVTFPSFENSFWKRIPIGCHMHVEVVPLSSIVDKEMRDADSINKQTEKWLDQKWIEKENELEYFTKHQSFDAEWTKNQRIENFNLIHRIRDLVPCLILLGIALLLDIVVFKGIRGLIYALLKYRVCLNCAIYGEK
ncbi:hypothetical protein WA171_004933 [Blastocystis sp. BT1]